MSKANTLFSYFQKTPTAKKNAEPVQSEQLSLIDNNANVTDKSTEDKFVKRGGVKPKTPSVLSSFKKSTQLKDKATGKARLQC